MVTVLVTGFEPFGKDKRNPSGEIARELDSSSVSGAKVIGAVLPVSYRRSVAELKGLIDKFRPLVVICTGLAPGSPVIKVERFALNIADSTHPDNDGVRKRGEEIVSGGEAALKSTLPVEEIVKTLLDEGIPAVASNYAGAYLCNYVMYHAIKLTSEYGGIAGFIHIPYTTDIVVEKLKAGEQPQPSLPREMVKKALTKAIEVSLSKAGNKT